MADITESYSKMRIPRLFDSNNPLGPKWVVPHLSASEVDSLAEALVMFVGVDPHQDNREVVLGSGFIVGKADNLIVATASHIFTWWVDKLIPPPASALRPEIGEREGFNRRLRKVVEQKRIFALVMPRNAVSGVICPLAGLAINSIPNDLDIGFAEVALPSSHADCDYRAIPIVADQFALDQPIMLAGYVGGGRPEISGGEPAGFGHFEQKIVVRAGRVGELETNAVGFRTPMYRVNVPSLAGMSGGPMLLMTSTALEDVWIPSATGIISRSRIGSPILLNHCDDGETWVCPIVFGLGRQIRAGGKAITISDAIAAGFVQAFGKVVEKFEFVRDDSGGVAKTSVRVRSNPSP